MPVRGRVGGDAANRSQPTSPAPPCPRCDAGGLTGCLGRGGGAGHPLPDRGQAAEAHGQLRHPRAHVATPGPVGDNDATSARGRDTAERRAAWAAISGTCRIAVTATSPRAHVATPGRSVRDGHHLPDRGQAAASWLVAMVVAAGSRPRGCVATPGRGGQRSSVGHHLPDRGQAAPVSTSRRRGDPSENRGHHLPDRGGAEASRRPGHWQHSRDFRP
jgi:hypothetical protein